VHVTTKQSRKCGPAIVLIGFMGSGKSTVSKQLALRTGMPRYDTDEMITTKTGMPITEIFAQRGEAEFRLLETEALAEVPEHAAIVVTGGGVVLRPENVTRLKELGLVVNLSATEQILFERISRRDTRPLLKTANPRETLAELWRVREPLYREAADFTLDTSRLRHREVADAILSHIESMRSSPESGGHE
jgi:shikimate kinase